MFVLEFLCGRSLNHQYDLIAVTNRVEIYTLTHFQYKQLNRTCEENRTKYKEIQVDNTLTTMNRMPQLNNTKRKWNKQLNRTCEENRTKGYIERKVKSN